MHKNAIRKARKTRFLTSKQPIKEEDIEKTKIEEGIRWVRALSPMKKQSPLKQKTILIWNDR